MEFEEDFYIRLIFECPFSNEIENCPFKIIRLPDVKQRLELYSKMDKSGFISNHLACIRKRECDKMKLKESNLTF